MKFFIFERCIKCDGEIIPTEYQFCHKCSRCGMLYNPISEKNLVGVNPKYKDKLTKEVKP